ncbi:efflux RND transporter periplasmic adaptor subunit [Brevibacillus laterosporus]|uniref:efflux RND transporter periplasmic adaptor subunit n=1 Tax=Brevibacillus laterosporus TaxID=1465 RepID=UPI000E6C93BC|nr:efflux RND transporter periplasmic adaptor subunit [Brevibacillus laterosporus]AYB36937.1 efflux RND transporter periplasmic adaptor subunit [Brevibacillus laterosporus]MBM7107341.1 Macrolide export protein MacA [Brevibacillus laterosporus]NKQ19894.1 efflux RND transporter periplasmic adaptor subunit [Brevibacillus laterosporus]WNX30270.1 efflux RND transporter periplasmic adaptor subunit [Brevibacillus laterosporus]
MKLKTKTNINKKMILVAASALFLVAGCSNQAAENTPAEQTESVTPVQIEMSKLGTVSSSAGFTAKLAPSQDVQLSPKISGKITSLPVSLGQYVKQGETLFSVDEQDVINSIKQAEAAYQVAKANLNQAGNSSSQGLEQAKNGLSQAQTALQDAERNQQRMQTLFNQGAISLQQYEQANLQLANAKTAVANAQEGVKSATQMSAVGVSEASVKQAAVSLENARTQLGNSVVKAPFSGYISSVNGAIGQVASPQSPVVTLVNTNPLVVKANLSEQDIPQVKVGDEVKVNITALGKELTAKVTAVSPVMDQQLKSYPIEISIPNPNNELKADMVVNMNLLGQQGKGQEKVVVPRKAVFDRDGKQYVYVVEGEVAKQVAVTTGEGSSEAIEILTGIKADQQVVIKGQTLLKDGSKVTIQK